MLPVVLVACTSAPPVAPLPPGLAPDMAVMRVVDRNLTLDGTVVASWADLDRSPTEDDDPTVSLALVTLAHRSLLLQLPADTYFWKVRKLLGSAKAAETGSIWLAADGANEAFPLAAPPRYGLGGACKDPSFVNTTCQRS